MRSMYIYTYIRSTKDETIYGYTTWNNKGLCLHMKTNSYAKGAAMLDCIIV